METQAIFHNDRGEVALWNVGTWLGVKICLAKESVQSLLKVCSCWMVRRHIELWLGVRTDCNQESHGCRPEVFTSDR